MSRELGFLARAWVACVLLLTALGPGAAAQGHVPTGQEPAVQEAAVLAALSRPFEENRGQAPQQYSHLLRAMGYTAGFTEDSLVVALPTPSQFADAPVLRFSWRNARAVTPQGEDAAGEQIFDLTLAAAAPHAGSAIPAFRRLRYDDLYPGIDVVYYQNAGHLEFDLEFAPRADPAMPVLRIDGADGLSLDAAGNLVITVREQQVVQRAPHSYQTRGGQRCTVASRYRIVDAEHVAIEVDAYDAALPLTVDPILDFATFFGGGGESTLIDVGTDAAGNVYLMGALAGARLPGDGDALTAVGGGVRNLYVTRLSPDLSTVHRTTYFSTTLSPFPSFGRMAVAPDGQVYVAYLMRGSVSQFGPTTGPYLYPSTATSSGLERMAILALTPDGSALRFRTLLGCTSRFFTGLLHAAADGLTFASATICTDFPVSPGAYTNIPPTTPASSQLVVGRLSPDGQQMPYLTRFGGDRSQELSWLHRDAEGRVWLSGTTTSADFPTTPGAHQTVRSADWDGYLLRFNPAGSAVEASTLLPGQVPRFRIAPDGAAHVLLRQTRTDFQVSSQALQTQRGRNAQVLLRMDPELRAISWSTYYLETSDVEDLAVNAAGETLVVSRVTADEPVTPGALLRRFVSGRQQHHLGRVGAGGTVLRNATYFFTPISGNATRILSFQGAVSTLVSGPRALPFTLPATTTTNLTVDQPGQPFGTYFARIQWDDPTACSLVLSPASQTVSAEGGEAVIRVEAPPGCPWALSQVSNLPVGLEILRSAGMGNGDLHVRYPRWNSADTDLAIQYRIDDQQVTVTQSRASCSRRSITPATVDIDATGGLLSLQFDIPLGCEWTWTAPGPWAVLTTDGTSPLPVGHQGPVPVRLEVLPNAFEARETSFTIAGVTVPVRQAGGACAATVAPLSVDLPASGGSASIQISTSAATCPWRAQATGDLTIVGAQTGTGSGTVQVSMPANPTNVPLEGALFVANKTVQVRQAAGQCQATVSPMNFQVGPSFSSFLINVQASGSACTWRPLVAEPWVQLFPQGVAEGTGQLRVNLRENKTGATRTATIRMLGATVTVTQLGEASAVVSFVVPLGEPFTVNGVSYVGPFETALPVGSTITVSAQPRRQPAPGVLVLNSGWNDVPELTRTFTVTSAPLTVRLMHTRFFRLQVSHTGNVAGDGSTASVDLPAGSWREEADGRYVRENVNAIVRARPGSLSRFVRWEGAPSGYSQSREFALWVNLPYTMTAVFEPLGPPPPLQFTPPRLALRYGSTQDIVSAVGNLSSATSVPVRGLGFGCSGTAIQPFSAALLATATPTTAQVNLQVHLAALLDPGQYTCEVVFGVTTNPAVAITVPVDLTIVEKQVPANAVRVAAITEGAAFRRVFPAPGSIASIFGERLAPGVFHAASLPLPTLLGDVRVELVHHQGFSASAPLFFVSPQQINYLVPVGFPEGITEVRVHRAGLLSASFPSFVQSHQPSLFSANSDGKGAPAGEFLRVHGQTGARVSDTLAECSGGAGACTPRPLSFGSAEETLFLVLYGTGFSALGGLAAVSIDGQALPVEFTGPQGSFVGLDQINVRVPRSFAGRGAVTLNVSFAGLSANPLVVNFQ